VFRSMGMLLFGAALAARAAASEPDLAADSPAPFLRELFAPAGATTAAAPSLDVRAERVRPPSGTTSSRAAVQADAAARAVAELRPHLARHRLLGPALQRLEAMGDLAGRLEAALAERPETPDAAADRDERIAQLSAALEVARQDYRARLAAAAAELRAALERPTLLVVAGGSSLGSYEAGFLHTLTEHLSALGRFARRLGLAKAGDDPGVFPVATGASAGSVNALLAVLASCRDPVARPEESIFYRVWIPVGLDALVGAEPEPGALFSRAALEDVVSTTGALLESDRGWSAEHPCQTLFGVSVTPIRSRTLELRPAGAAPGSGSAVTVHRHTEKFMFEIAGEPGRPPWLRPFTPPLPEGADPAHARLYPSFSPVREDGSVAFADFAELLQASTSLPLVFRPVPLSYRLPGEAEEQTQRFIDGGVLDNTPLRLALKMNRWRGPRSGAQDPWVLFLEPDAHGWEAFRRERRERAWRSNMAEYLASFSDFVAAAREAELADAIETEPHLGSRLLIPAAQMPLASANLNNFLGFMERDFRVSDFHQGMADAIDHLWRNSEAFHVLRAEGALPEIDSPIFACFAAYRAELRASADPAPETLPVCRALGHAKDASERNALALLRASRGMKAWIRSPDHDEARELGQFFVLLERYGYEFRDLRYRGRPATARTALKAIRDEMQRQAQALGRLEKNIGIRMGVVTVGKALANEVAFRVPRQFSFVGLQIDSGFEAGYARQLFDERLRLVMTGKVYAFDRNLTRSGYEHGVNAATFAASARAVLEIPGSNVLQPEVGLGWGVFSRDGWGRHLFWRHGPEASLGASIFQRLYLDVALTWFLDGCAGDNTCSQVGSRYRNDPVPLVLYRREVRGSIGWRFLID